MQRGQFLGRGAATGGMALLAIGPSIVKLVDISETAFALWRLLAAIGFYGVFLIIAGNRLRWSDLRRSALGGVVFGLTMVVFFLSVRRTSAVNWVVIASLQPIVLMAVGHRLFGERPHRSVYYWSGLAFIGVVVTISGSGTGGVATRWGDFLAVISMLLHAGYFVISKRIRSEMKSLNYQLSLTVAATVTVLPFALLYKGGIVLPTTNDWWLVVVMVLAPGTGHFLNNFAHGYTSLTMVSLINLGLTAVAPLYAWWIVDESIASVQAFGMCLAIGALAFVVTRPVEVIK